MKRVNYPEKEAWAELCKRSVKEQTELTSIVAQIFNEVITEGDEAVLRYTRRFDYANACLLYTSNWFEIVANFIKYIWS